MISEPGLSGTNKSEFGMMRPVAASRQVTSILMVDPNVLTHSHVADLRTGRGNYMGPHHAARSFKASTHAPPSPT